MYLMSMAQLWALALCLQVCQHLTSCLEMFPCVSETSNPNLVNEALMEAKILSSTLSMYLFNLAWIVGASAIPMGVSTPPKWSRNLPMCLRNLQRTFGAWGPNRSWNTDCPTLPCLCSTWLWFLLLVLSLQVCQHLPSNLQMFLCVLGASKIFGAWGPNSSWDIDIPTLLWICSTQPSFECWQSTCRFGNTSHVI